MNISALITDDEALAREGVRDHIAKIDFVTLAGECRNAIEANAFLQNNKVDLIFLDIQMPEISGLDWLKSMIDPPMVVFTTAYREYAAESFDLEVVDYLVKPISFQRFLKACNKALKQLENKEVAALHHLEIKSENEDSFFIKADNKFIRIYFDDILFIEGLKDYVAIHTATKKYMALISLKSVEAKLPAKDFIRAHRSYIVAIKKIKAIENNMLKIADASIPVSREMQEKVYAIVLKDRVWKRGE